MARKSPPGPPPTPPSAPLGECNEVLKKLLDRGRKILQSPPVGEAALKTWSNLVREQLIAAFGSDSNYVDNFASAGVRFAWMGDVDWDQERARECAEKIDMLESILEAIAFKLTVHKTPVTAAPTSPEVDTSSVFIVHGHDDAAKIAVARLLEHLGLTPIILHEQPNQGRTIIEKLEANSAKASFAVVLLTPDDVGGKHGGNQQARARQNVVLEMGIFIGKLGRSKVCSLYTEGVELPSDLNGVAYTPMDRAGAWKTELARELKGAGFKIDFNKLF